MRTKALLIVCLVLIVIFSSCNEPTHIDEYLLVPDIPANMNVPVDIELNNDWTTIEID